MSCHQFQIQSGTAEGNVAVSSSTTKAKNVTFKDRVEPYVYSVDTAVDETRKSQDAEESPLGEFFARPVKIAEFEWGTGTTLAEQFNPWEAFFFDTRVVNRLTNFKLMRSSLKLRVLINGNAFQYGRAIMYYRPMFVYDNLSSDSALIRQDLVQGSQCPHIYLDPNTSQGGEMTIPFFWHKNYFDLNDEDLEEAGRIYIRSLNNLKHANGATDRVTITILAWTEDIHLSGLTSVDANGFIPQMGEFEQANTRGIVSGPATMMAKVAGALSTIPAIRPYALASQMAANSIASIAKMFGYCKPTITKAPEPFRPTPTSSLAVTNVPDNSQKLTVDHMQELTIDPRISGIESLDPLNILSIAQRESYLTTFSWVVGTAPDTLLWNSRVQPVQWAESLEAVHFTALAVAALPFQKWTGTIKYRFQIVSSSYHRGRLRIVWDPNYIVDANENYNVVNSTIVDISEERDFTVAVSNGQSVTYMEHLFPGQFSVTNSFSSTPYTSLVTNGAIPMHNGILGVYVLNELTVPNSTINNDIEINVFVSAGDDFEVAVPDDFFQRFSFKPQSGLIDTPEEGTEQPSAPIQSTAMEMHASRGENNASNLVYMGETIASFRPLLKRFNLHTSRSPLLAGANIMGGNFSAFPFLRGNVADAIHSTDTGATYNYCNTVLLHWVTMPFCGWRGSLRWKVIPRGPSLDSGPMSMYLTRQAADIPVDYAEYTLPQELYSTRSAAASAGTIDFPYGSGDVQRMPSGTRGSAYTHEAVNPVCELEVPFYSTYRFAPGKIENYTSAGTGIPTGPRVDYRIVLQGDKRTIIDFHCAAGDDFQTYFWTGMPRMYYTPTNPPPITVV